MVSTTTWFFFTVVTICVMTVLTIASAFLFKKAYDLNPLIATRKHLLDDIQMAQQTISELTQQRDELAADLANAKDTIARGEELKKWLQEHGGTVDDLEAKINEAKTKLDEIEDKCQEADEKFQKVQEETTKQRQACENAKYEMEKYQKEADRLQTDIKNAGETQKDLESQIDALREEKGKLSGEVEQLKSELALLQKDKEQQQLLQRKNNQLIEQNSELETKIAANTGIIAGNEGKDRWVSLDKPYIDPSKKTGTFRKNEEEWLTDFMNHLKENNIIFSDRVVKAFHTSLKVEDFSPLVVLAGISGTGKSLLPELYAAAMGMNFLQVAVQPRWDSPQDMFGFYNYMQGKYKATELSRLLWQYDFFNNEQNAQGIVWKNGQNEIRNAKERTPMNLVLLDEMNLARVEYYFSDMLSKLEVRKTINPFITDQRRPAEVELESGPSKSAAGNRRLFVGSNTLFVGTMNEDETTQALSDKVIDRSNVLRFGKPAELQSQANPQAFMSAYQDVPLLSYQDWKIRLYSNRLSKSEPDRLRDWMTRLNNQLALIGRPFGHRVWEATLNYVTQYPRLNDPEGFHHAIADQMEMKILPKLNGLEKEQVNINKGLKEIGLLLHELEDEKLLEAYEGVRNDQNSAFFQWKGVVRE